jgi:hypothetical protein
MHDFHILILFLEAASLFSFVTTKDNYRARSFDTRDNDFSMMRMNSFERRVELERAMIK